MIQGMQFIPYEELGTTPNIIVDGEGNKHTSITLSHWPESDTPEELKDDLSTQIVFRYLDRPNLWVNVDAVSNNHFDEDGLVGIYSLLNPQEAQSNRKFLIEIAKAGDFRTYQFREAARITFVLSMFADPDSSPLSKTIFQNPYAQFNADLYQELLPKFSEIIHNLERFRPYWEYEDAFLNESERMIQNGSIQIEETPSIDLAIVTLPETLSQKKISRFTQKDQALCHPMAIYNAIQSFRVLLIQGQSYELQYRYETWVQYQSQKPMARIDLTPLAQMLSDEESGGGEWKFNGVKRITPHLFLTGKEASQIPPHRFKEYIKKFLAKTPPSWSPYGEVDENF